MRVDHLVYGAADLADGVARLDRLLGVRALPGGRHPAWGTHNALIGLTGDCYIEVLAPDPAASVRGTLATMLAALAAPRLVTFAARTLDLEAAVGRALDAGVDLGPIEDMAGDGPHRAATGRRGAIPRRLG